MHHGFLWNKAIDVKENCTHLTDLSHSMVSSLPKKNDLFVFFLHKEAREQTDIVRKSLVGKRPVNCNTSLDLPRENSEKLV